MEQVFIMTGILKLMENKKCFSQKGSLSMGYGEHILIAVLNVVGISILFRHITARKIREGKVN